MRVNHKKVQEIAESWLSGNLSYNREQVKKLTKLEFYFLVSAICSMSNNDEEKTANNLVGNI